MESDPPRPLSNSSANSFVSGDRGPRPNQPICIGEEVRIGIHLAVERFSLNEAQKGEDLLRYMFIALHV